MNGTATGDVPAVMPAGAIDAHAHVFVAPGVSRGGRPASAAYAPPDVGVDDVARHLDDLGCSRGVLVQPSAFGTEDHTCLLAALSARPDAFRGVACLPVGTPPDVLARMHEAGVRAVRVQDEFPGGVPVTDLLEVAHMVRPYGWHVEVWTDPLRHPELLTEVVPRAPVPVVLDHLGNVPSDVGPDHPVLRTIVHLVASGDMWACLSGAERLVPSGSSIGPRQHDDLVDARVAQLVAANPDRLVWGSDWPHVGLTTPAPGPRLLRSRLDRWVSGTGLRRRILVDNPTRLYDF